MSNENEMKRLSAYLADPIYDHLDDWARSENRSLSSLVGYLLERAVREHQKDLTEKNGKE